MPATDFVTTPWAARFKVGIARLNTVFMSQTCQKSVKLSVVFGNSARIREGFCDFTILLFQTSCQSCTAAQSKWSETWCRWSAENKIFWKIAVNNYKQSISYNRYKNNNQRKLAPLQWSSTDRQLAIMPIIIE